MRRLDEIRDANSLAVLKTLPQARCHPLKGDLEGRWAVDLEHPHRLTFEPAHDPLPVRDDGSLDVDRVTAIRIIGVEDYHG
jgi:plasmid maintenance system killer protein